MDRGRWRHHRPLFTTPAPAAPPEKRARFSIFGFFWRVLRRILWLAWYVVRRTCTVIGFAVLLTAFMGGMSAYDSFHRAPVALPDQMVLYLDFRDGVLETPQQASFSDPFSYGQPTLHDTVDAILKAKNDKRVVGIFARLDDAHIGVEHAAELREAIQAFRATGKFAYVYSPSFEDGAGGFGAYYLAAAFDEIWMQPMGVVAISGISAQMPFVRGVLEKIGVQPQFFQRKEYKTAYESFTNEKMSDANRESTQLLIDDIHNALVADIAADRGMTQVRFENLVDKGLFTAKEAVYTGLVTTANYADILVARISKAVTGDPDSEEDIFVGLEDYITDLHKERAPIPLEEAFEAPRKPRVALIYAVGMIMPSGDGGIASADTIAPAILDAADDESVKAIVLRINSPGGSPVASESILRSLQRAQRKGKPVIVSMGPMAASGGYWIATYADMIFAMPATLTGSIGVLGGKVATQQLWDKLGVNWESVKWGENSEMFSLVSPFSDSEKERFNAMLDQVYTGFVGRVADGRGMLPQEVEKVAKGHVWTGVSAQKAGLVDEMGTLQDALTFTAQLLGGYSTEDIDVTVIPKRKNAFEELVDMLESQTQVIEGLHLQGVLAALLKPYAEDFTAAQALQKAPAGGLAYEPLRLR